MRIGSIGSIKVAALVGAAGIFLAYFMALEVWGILLYFSDSVFKDSSWAVLRTLMSIQIQICLHLAHDGAMQCSTIYDRCRDYFP